MQKLKHDPKSGVLHPGWLLAVRLFIGLAFLTGTYLLIISVQGMNAVGCGPDSGCEKVLHSRWAYWFGLPVSAFALAVYATIFGATFRLRPKTALAVQRKIWTLLVPAAVAVVGAAVWFVILQLFVIKAICPFCMAAHGSGLIAAILILLAAPFAPVPEKSRQREKEVYVAPSSAKRLVALALAGVALLVVGQILHQQKSFAVASIPLSTQQATNSAPIVPLATNTAINSPTNSGLIPPNPYAGMFYIVYQTNVLDLRQVPIIGSPNAPYVLVSLYDYTCKQCRFMHKPLMETFHTFSNKLAIVSLPMPLDPQCNHCVRVASGAHTNGCKFARLALTVWRADRSKLPQFDEFMFKDPLPPTVEEAEEFATTLLGGSEAFARAQQDPWIEQQLQQNVQIYEFSFNQQRGTMPQIIVGRQVVLGNIDMSSLFELIAKQYGLVAPPPG